MTRGLVYAETLPAGILSTKDALDDGNAYDSAARATAERIITQRNAIVNFVGIRRQRMCLIRLQSRQTYKTVSVRADKNQSLVTVTALISLDILRGTHFAVGSCGLHKPKKARTKMPKNYAIANQLRIQRPL